MRSNASTAAISAALLTTVFSTASVLNAQQVGPDQAILKERAATTQRVDFDVYIPVQHREQLEQDLARMHDPNSPTYRKWLKPGEFNARYGASASQLRAIQSQLASYGLESSAVTGHRIHVTGAAGAIEQMFGTVLKMGTFASGETMIAATLPLIETGAMLETKAVVTGLSPIIRMQSHAHPVALPDNRYSPVGPYWFDDLKQAYHYPSIKAYGGYGTTIGILMSNDFNRKDMDLYFGHEKLPTPKFSTENIDGGGPFDKNLSFETHLDLQQSGGMAPHANIILYNLPNLADVHIINGLSAIVSENKVDVVNMSFGGDELYYTAAYSGMDYTGVLRLEDDLFAQGNAEGITFVASSGDAGALDALPVSCVYAQVPKCGQFVPAVQFPASSPHVTAVGGTNLITSHSGIKGDLNSTYVREQAFADALVGDIHHGTSATGGYWGSGGGDSVLFQKPAYQALVDTGNKRFRTVPDVSLHMGGCPGGTINPCNPDDSADLEVLNATLYGVIGTSASAPDFAGLTALTVQRFGSRIGNANYYIYALAAAQARGFAPKVFHTNVPGYNGLYSTTPTGYNRVLGNGTVDGLNFMLAPFAPGAGVPQTPSNP